MEKIGKRHIQYILLFTAGLTCFISRGSLSIAILAMISKDSQGVKTYPEWHNKDIILSSFFWGYVAIQPVAGIIGDRYNAKYAVSFASTVAALVTLLVPYLADYLGSEGVILSRVVQGVAQGFIFPFTHSMLSKWTPLPERSRVVALIFSAPLLGITVSMFFTGYICDCFGWPMVFYLLGALDLIWIFFFIWFGYNKPNDDKTLSVNEREYIEQNTQVTIGKKIPIPWSSILKSPKVASLVLTHAGIAYGFWTLQTEIPSYLMGVFKVDLKNNSLLSTLSFVTAFAVSILFGALADFLLSKKWLSLVATRKLFVFIGTYGPASALITISFLPIFMKEVAISILIMGVGLSSATLVGYQPNHMEIAPNFAGILMGIAGFFGNIASFVAPLTVQFVITDQTDHNQWRTVFLIAGTFYITCGTIFIIFASAKVQKWNYEESPEEIEIEKREKMNESNGTDGTVE